MRVALCVSGDFTPDSNIIATACAQILPQDTVDVFAYLWTPPGTGEEQLRNWFDRQLNDRIVLRRWTFDTMRAMGDWNKYSAKHTKYSAKFFQDLERMEWALQCVCQLKTEQERLDNGTYDAVVRVESTININFAPRLAIFGPILDDHIIIGINGPLPWFPAYDFRVAMMSSFNMDVYSAVQTLHRRQYLLRRSTVTIQAALVEHLLHARLKSCCVPMGIAQC